MHQNKNTQRPTTMKIKVKKAFVKFLDFQCKVMGFLPYSLIVDFDYQPGDYGWSMEAFPDDSICK